MRNPRVSIIIPTYNGREHLGESIQSLLDQTYHNIEIIVVDDASSEDTADAIGRLTDSRIRYIRHEINLGAVAARQTGVRASSGEIIAFLDQDDLFHAEKIQLHVNYLRRNPKVGMSYNGRFEVIGPEKAVCGIYKPSASLCLSDWILGFPVSPSDVVLRREWALLDEIWDASFSHQTEHVIFNGHEIVFGGRLALAGCEFGAVGKALNYRRYHPYRVLKHLSARCQAELACQKIIFSDPRCPDHVQALSNVAFSNIYVIWAYIAFIQEEFDLGREFLKQTLSLNPTFFKGDPCPFLSSWLLWISAGTVDYVRSHEEILQSVFTNLPRELQHLRSRRDEIIAKSYLLKGFHTMIWGNREDAEAFLRTALEKGANVDSGAMRMLSDELLNYEDELGNSSDRRVMDDLYCLLSKLNRKHSARLLKGFFSISRAFRNFHSGCYDPVPRDVVQAMRADTGYLLNRGALSILIRSLWRRTRLTVIPSHTPAEQTQSKSW